MMLQLLLVLLLVGVAEADPVQLNTGGYVHILYKDDAGCVAYQKEGHPVTMTCPPSPCEQKLKEAMKLAQEHKDALFTQLYWKATAYSGIYGSARCITVECLQKELDEAKAAEKAVSELKQAKIRWEAIYQECVK